MNFSRTTNKLKHAAFYIPFTIYFVVFAIAAFIGFKMLGNNEINADSSFTDIFQLLLKVALAFTIAIISVAFIPVLISFLYFMYKKRKTGIRFGISTDVKESRLNEKQTVRLAISPVLKPFFGFIRLRLLYDQKHYSKKFSLLENSKRKFFSTSIEGTYHWTLPQIKEYHVEKAVLYFEDVFQFFSIAVNLPASSHFFTQPTTKGIKDLNVLPRKTEETNTRIEQLRKVEGEYLNYKNFENNDDVRRIVWKIYAKNKELVVRIPEIMDPYASHVYLYASFFSHFDIEGNGAVEVPFLNYFKVITWSVYQNLVKRGFEVRYVPDQEVAKNNTADEQQSVKYSISTSKWHNVKDLKTYVKTNDASIVLISSLSDADEVQDLMENAGGDITFIFIKLTDSFKNQNVIDWVQWLFIENQKDDVDVYKRGWALSPLRVRIKENERKLAEILQKYQGAETAIIGTK
ncbi:DUF58 domain-containing protein [Segetibacter koreensis]|uniref:DUF58 domain-containing protein n=1 Tax=Segetibacter koreensis TaxID=398037 RepID=UPI000368CEAD|nr:DUF58 domain-containing protein [Segetibacter koreensis]